MIRARCKLIEEHRDTVIAVLSGHLHLTGMKQQREIYHVSIAGTASYPCDFAVYDVFPDRMEVAVKQLPDELAKSAKRASTAKNDMAAISRTRNIAPQRNTNAVGQTKGVSRSPCRAANC